MVQKRNGEVASARREAVGVSPARFWRRPESNKDPSCGSLQGMPEKGSEAMIVMGTDPDGRTQVFNRGGYVTTIGRQIAHRSLYPDRYVPRKPAKREIASELSAEIGAFLRSKTWFWGVAIAAFTWLAYIFVHWAITVEGATRIH